MPDMDQGVKRLIQTYPADVLHLALPDAEYLGAAPIEVATEPQLTLDTLQRVRYQGDECLIDIEVEARPKTDIGHRLYMYATRAHIVHQLPVYSVVLWLEPHGKPVSSPYVMRAGDKVCCQWYFTGVELYRLQAGDLLAQGAVGLLPLIPFTAGGASEVVIEQTAQQLKQRADQPELGELVTLLAVFAARHFDDAFVLDLVRRAQMSTEIIEQSSLYQRWIREGRQEGRQEGREEGRQEGREEGLREGLLTVLTGRFGALPAEVEQAIASASVVVLDDTLLHAGAESLEQLQARLGAA